MEKGHRSEEDYLLLTLCTDASKGARRRRLSLRGKERPEGRVEGGMFGCGVPPPFPGPGGRGVIKVLSENEEMVPAPGVAGDPPEPRA